MPGLKSFIQRRSGKSKLWPQKELDDFLVSNIRPITPLTAFHPSYCGKCQRCIQYKMLGVKPDKTIPAHVLRNMDNGTYVGQRFYEYFGKMGILVASEEVCKYNCPPISGRLDCIIKNPESDELILVELKSRNDRRWTALQQIEYETLLQWQLYSLMTGIENGIVIYENQNNYKVKMYPVSYQPSLVNNLLFSLNHVLAANAKDMLVPIPEVCEAGYCDFKSTCVNDKTKDVLPAAFVPLM